MVRVVCCLLVILASVYLKAQGYDKCNTYDMGSAVALIVQLRTEIASMQAKVSTQQRIIEAVEKKNDDMQEKLASQQKKVEAVEKKNDDMQEKLASQQKKVEAVERKNDDMQEKLAAQQKKVEEVERKNDDMQEKLAAQQKKVEEVERKNDDMQEKLASQQKMLEAFEKKNEALGFSVKRPKTIASGVMIFKITNANTGGSYSLATGVFTCRIPGYYYFSATLLKRAAYDDDTFCRILKNDVALVKAFTEPGQSSSEHKGWMAAVTAVYVHLDFGDTVKLGDCTELTSWDYEEDGCSFSGFLVTPDTA